MSDEKWVVFDLIGVLAEPSWRDIAMKSQEDWNRFKHGELPEAEFWSDKERALYLTLLSFRDDRLDLVRRLKGQGYRVCVATNFFQEWLNALLSTIEDADIFDETVLSSEVKAAKPEPAFFEAVLRHAPKGSVFIDDRKQNCDAAREAGFRSIWAHPACPLEEELDRLLQADAELARSSLTPS